MIIKVTQDDIEKGERGSYCLCPVALALRRAGVSSVNVQFTKAFGFFRGQEFKGKLPAKTGRFIARFDLSQPVKPFSFNLELPNE